VAAQRVSGVINRPDGKQRSERPPEYCTGRGHTRVSAWRERRRLAAERNGAVISPAEDASPVTMAKMTGAELLRSLQPGRADPETPPGS
jgi:hypothetical protein